jgi:predicted permease
MDGLWQDLRQASRQLLRDGGFTTAALLTFTLGIGATALMFNVVHAVLLRQIPYRNPEELVILGEVVTGRAEARSGPLSLADLADWRKGNTSFSDLAVFGALAFNLEQGENSQRIIGELVNHGYFRLLGLQPALGRFFAPEEDLHPMERFVVVLGYDLWQSAFGGDPGVVGRTVHLNGRLFQVVGVGPRGFRGLTDRGDLWIPSMITPLPTFVTSRSLRWASAVARLAPGVTPPQAERQLNSVSAALAKEFPASNRGFGAAVRPLRDYWFGRLRRGLLVLTGGAGILLVIACINVASLSLARAVTRRRALGVRIALGASRGSLARHLLAESLLLALVGALLGCLAAHLGAPALLAAGSIELPSFVHLGIDPQVFAVTVALALVCGFAFGLAPLSVSLRADLAGGLAREGRQPQKPGRIRFRGTVIVAQVALVLILSVAAGLLAKGFHRMVSQNLGFSADGLLTLRIDPRGPAFADEAKVTRLLGETYLPRLAAVPGVGRLAIVNPSIPTDGQTGGAITFEDHDSALPDGTYPTLWRSVTPEYFALFKVPILRGRAFNLEDKASNAVIVSRAMAEAQWPGRDPLGRRLKLGPRGDEMLPWLTIVGVVGDVQHEPYRMDREPVPDIYLSLLQFVRRPPLTVNILARPKAGVSIEDLRGALHRELVAIDPELPDYDAATMEERLVQASARVRFQVVLIGLFTVVALTLSAIGIYGVVSHGIAERRRELTLRMALGADRKRLLLLVVGRGALLVGLGLVLGLIVVVALGRYLAALLYKTSPTDPLVLGGISLGLFLVALIANYLPARRGTTDDAVLALRLR